MAAREPTLTIEIKSSDFADVPFEYTLREGSGRPHFEIICGAIESGSMSREEQQQFKERLFELLAAICARIIVADNILEALKQIFNGLSSDLGQVDTDERLRISIIKGVNKSKPAWYRLVLASNLDAELQNRDI
jgi:hypothetical protein